MPGQSSDIYLISQWSTSKFSLAFSLASSHESAASLTFQRHSPKGLFPGTQSPNTSDNLLQTWKFFLALKNSHAPVIYCKCNPTNLNLGTNNKYTTLSYPSTSHTIFICVVIFISSSALKVSRKKLEDQDIKKSGPTDHSLTAQCLHNTQPS